jgi:NAD(P)-dependent dehydrogenase (short-subunit alcohol dehydrogenase family)
MAEQTFANQKAVISGATGQIGFAIAERIVNEGGSVSMIGRREGALQEAVARLGDQASYALVDVDSDQEVADYIDGFDRVDIVACTAGWTVIGPVEELPVGEALAMFNSRFFGQCRMIKSALPKIPDGGIILLCSGVGNRAFYPYYAFGAAVAGAIEAYSHHLAGELAPRKIRVNTISPGWTVAAEPDAERSSRAAKPFASEGAQMNAFLQSLDSPMHEIIQPEEFADALVFIARAKHYTGQVIRLDAARSVTDNPLDGAVEPFSYAPQ